jgi:hypothetical protein
MERGHMTMNKSDFDTLVALTETIENPGVRVNVKDFLTTVVPAYFKTLPASTTGKYHPAYTLGESGLIRHTVAAVKILNHTLNLEWARKAFTPLQRDKMRAALILHDTFKQGASGNDRDAYKIHEIIAADEFERYVCTPNTDIGRLMRCHMGEWGRQHPVQLDEYLVHLADYLASRKDITVETA